VKGEDIGAAGCSIGYCCCWDIYGSSSIGGGNNNNDVSLYEE